MRVFVNGKEVGNEYTGYALCGDNRQTGTYLGIDGTLRCKTCGRPWRGFYQDVGGAKLYFCCGDHYRGFIRIIRRVVKVRDLTRMRTVSISVNGGERIVRVEYEDGGEAATTEPILDPLNK